ncbi:MAG: hypothetical protein BWZ10_03282 [candidate division BRC1 bacterium ADurb.BinA364]|nr:MAG: hypothetical protein BWZ10_03282 [candidate division BRC1 bacterium ADurb.BinA364]
MIKNSLHHSPDPQAALREAARASRPGALAMVFEHIRLKPRLECWTKKAMERNAAAVLERYPPQRPSWPAAADSANEDIGMRSAEAALDAAIECEERRGEILWTDDFLLPWYFAWGRPRRLFAALGAAGYCFERLALRLGAQPAYLAILGRMRPLPRMPAPAEHD